MLKSGLLGLGLAALFVVQSSAAVVGFSGVFTNQTLPAGGGAGSALGAVPPAVAFAMSLNVTDGAGPAGAITGGTIVIGGTTSPIAINSGTVTLTDGGASDIAAFVVNVANGGGANNGQMNFTFTGGDFFTGTAINQAAFYELMHDKVSAGLTYLDFGNGQVSNYAGTITAVPEPTTFSVFGLALGAVALRRRRR